MRIARAQTPAGATTVVDTGSGWRTSGKSVIDLVRGADPGGGTAVEDVPDFLAPLVPPTLFGVGLNYVDTVAQMGWQTPVEPYLFPKLSSSVTGPTGDIVVDLDLTTRVDWEAELGVVIGRDCRHVSEDDALDVVFGYVAANDISARDLQADDGQWVRGKGLDTFCPLGPWIRTADEVPDPQSLDVRTWLNGTLVQDGHTASMIFDVRQLVAYISRFFTLRAGDVILTGTPAGCGDFRTPPIALVPGDLLEIEVERLGRQRTPVVAP